MTKEMKTRMINRTVTRIRAIPVCLATALMLIGLAGCESSQAAAEDEPAAQPTGENTRHTLGSDTPRYRVVSGPTGMERSDPWDRGAGSAPEIVGEEIGKAPPAVNEAAAYDSRLITTITVDAVPVDDFGRPVDRGL